MGIDKQGSKSGNYVGGFLQLFDWNAKSRKKLFSSKSDLAEKSKQKKQFDGNLPMPRIQMLDEDDAAARSSIKGSSDYSRASSVTDEDFYGTRAPGLVARLMGLDSLPKSNSLEPNSTPFDSRSLPGSYYQSKNLEYRCEYNQDPQIMMHSTSSQDGMEPKHQEVIHRPIEKFQTEILPPKSAKSIPITCHKLLSPIKSANPIPPKDAAHIMEAAARIIEPGPQASKKTKLPLAGSSSAPLKVKDWREKVQAAQKPSKVSEGSQRLSESSAVKQLKGHSMNKSWNGSVDTTLLRSSPHSEEYSVSVKSKDKSISLALQAKANVQKREGLSLSSSRTFVGQKEMSEVSPKKPFTNQSTEQKSKIKKPSTRNCSSVLRQNNQKQNCNIDRGKLPLKSNLQGGKAMDGDSSSSKRNSSKLVGASKNGSQKLGSVIKVDKKQVLSSSSERVTRKKQSIDGKYHSKRNRDAHNIRKDKNGKVIQSSADMDTQINLDQDSKRMGSDVISFTFTAPMTRSGPGSGRVLLNSDDTSATKISFTGHNVKGGDMLSNLLEQKLKELNHKVELSQQKSGSALHGTENKIDDRNYADNLNGHLGSGYQGLVIETGVQGRIISDQRKLLDCRLPSPVSVLDHSSSFGENSSDTVESNSTGGSKQYSSVQFHDVLSRCSMNTFLPFEGDAELSDSASSTSAGMIVKRQETTLTYGKPRTWELEYVKAIMCNIEMMFKDYAFGKASKIINPRLFNQLESQKGYFNGCGLIPRIHSRLLFDCVSECLDMRCRQYVGGGYELCTRGMWIIKQKDKLAEDVYKDISHWTAMGDFMVDELVDNDMSSQYGTWLNHDIEAFELGVQVESRILNSLIDEVVADILML
ncbi:hypothetical protein CDL12_08088 [Handroanthus impetiginosus]|uniref:DUF4378 domain-containing protein n=1 Tax=Handroanthus impetiginosus TaxID=429701 RepID=A0A2G9HNY0_9LAMI|nr:hypothetical protein CDL12_08088 [Handroanthus impetiginosus]